MSVSAGSAQSTSFHDDSTTSRDHASSVAMVSLSLVCLIITQPRWSRQRRYDSAAHVAASNSLPGSRQ